MSQHNSLEAQIIARAAKDATFRQNLLRDPRATLEKEFGVKLRSTVSIQVHEETENVRHLVLPRLAQPQMVTLDEGQLSAAVGGMNKPKVQTSMCTLYVSSNGKVPGTDPVGDGCDEVVGITYGFYN